jgi:hypothetical protein
MRVDDDDEPEVYYAQLMYLVLDRRVAHSKRFCSDTRTPLW